MKRLIDLFGSALMLILLSPLMLAASLGVFVFLGWPIFFRQIRAGSFGKPFELIKFRTMRNDAGPDHLRLTKFGRFLRASSLDELPELFNVMKGDMSLVGPRPLLMEYLPLYSPEQARRHEVRPGITGLAQINGRNGLSWEQKFEYDVEYVEHHNLVLDAKILFRTIFVIVSAKGINRSEDVTMAPFEGRKEAHQRGKGE
jgi:lipopolysaccharide/colanic/teichoic acid biosynthesis glycosyltransferase